ncbi:MAG: BREX-1 system phosphatase PglZ type A [Propionibacteriaceae bacterium]|jgi:uncharacterized protein (TIGR02687 family)|nr:BREX-1 system phosphatase PglZ type A [Propionibacteriaceae bacterium]
MSPLDPIVRQLQQRFISEDRRIVVWSDPEDEYADRLTEFDLPGVTVLRVDGNEFGIKHRVLAEEPTGKFLIYRAGPRPATPLENWLLDLELAYGLFTADRAALVLQELGDVTGKLRGLVERYPMFFKSTKRTEALGDLVDQSVFKLDDEKFVKTVSSKMIQVIIGSEDHTLQGIWRKLLEENAVGKTTAVDEIGRFELAEFHWKGTGDIYGYASDEPSVDDFVLWLFDLDWKRFSSETPGLYRNIQIDFGHWGNDQRFVKTFRALADRAATDLGISGRLASSSLPSLMGRFAFRQIDEWIVDELARAVETRTMVDKDVQDCIRQRTTGAWYYQFDHLYAAIAAASTMLTLIDGMSLSLTSPADGFRRYTTQLYRIDQTYRHFIWHNDLAEASSPLEKLKVKIEGFYSTRYLAPLGAAWQTQIDTLDRWGIFGVSAQTSFFREQVEPFLKRGNKVVVIISDGLRYEIADELRSRIRETDRFNAELSAMSSTFPSYTQLGMASLLPHKALAFDDGDKVLVDGAASDGTKNRAKILSGVGGTAIQAGDFMKLRKDDARELIKAHRVLYVYHNQIDDTGDHVSSEGRVFRAAEDTLDELERLVKKLTGGANVNNILITADHGFLYQDGGLDESGYLSVKPQGDKLLVANNRRFVLGHGLKRDPAFITFTTAQLGMEGDVEAQVPKSIHRLCVAGSGSKYVHGGTALQEIVVPVLTVNKGRRSDTRWVEVALLAVPERITTSQITVTLFQEEPVSEKVKPRTLVAGLYVGEILISNEVTVEFSRTSADKRERYFEIKLILGQEADQFNNQTVELRLAESIADTTQRRPYPLKARSTLVRTFTSDFDF